VGTQAGIAGLIGRYDGRCKPETQPLIKPDSATIGASR
jgi:hypothetical protein